MKINHGPAAVRGHADSAGLTAGISAIVRCFGKDAIKDIEIHACGEVSVLHELSPELHRVIPGVVGTMTTKDVIKQSKEVKR